MIYIIYMITNIYPIIDIRKRVEFLYLSETNLYTYIKIPDLGAFDKDIACIFIELILDIDHVLIGLYRPPNTNSTAFYYIDHRTLILPPSLYADHRTLILPPSHYTDHRTLILPPSLYSDHRTLILPPSHGYAFCMVFHVRWIFLTTSLRIPPESRSDEGGIRRRVVRNPSHMENHTKCIFSHTLHFNAL